MVNKKIFQKGYIYLCKRLHVLCNLFAYTHHKAHDYKCNLHKNLLFILMDIRLFFC